jgi:hypothetical protein
MCIREMYDRVGTLGGVILTLPERLETDFEVNIGVGGKLWLQVVPILTFRYRLPLN